MKDVLPMWCYIFLKPIKADKKNFVTHVPLRMAKQLKGLANVMVIYRGQIDEESLNEAGIRCLRYTNLSNMFLLNWWNYFFFIRKNVKQHNVRILQNVWAHYLLWPLNLLLKRANVQIIARVSGLPISGPNGKKGMKYIKNRLANIIEKRSLLGAHKIQFLSESLRQEFNERGLEKKDSFVLSQGVDLEQFSYHSREFDFPLLKLVYIGRLSKLKGISHLIEAVDALGATEKSSIKVSIFGGGDKTEQHRLADQISKYKLENIIILHGHIQHEHMASIIKSYDLLVLPSLTEGAPNVVLEAMASGLPVLATRVGEIPVWLQDGRGILVEPGSSSSLKEGLRGVLSNRKQLKTISLSAKDYVDQHHSFQKTKIDLQNLILHDSKDLIIYK